MNNLLIYDPSCTSVQDIKSKVRHHETGLGFVFGGYIYHKQNNQVSSYKITTDAMARCFNRNDNDEIESSIHNLLSAFSNNLGDIIDYDLEILSINQRVILPNSNSGDGDYICMFSLSSRLNTKDYFDLCLYNNSNRTLCYNLTNLDTFKHSGDMHNNTNGGFLHTIKTVSSTNTSSFYLSVIGYNMKPLHTFTSQTPSVCLVNHHTRTIYIVPCPLDVMSMGENGVFAILAKGNCTPDGIEITILPRPITRAKVNTGYSNPNTANAIREAASVNMVSINNQSEAIEPQDEYVMDFNEVPLCDVSTSPIVVVQDRYAVPLELTQQMECYYFGTTISFEDERASIILPIAGGSTVMGDNVLVHAKTPKVQNYTNILKSSRCVVIVVGEEMQNSLIDKCQNKVNAVFVVEPADDIGSVTDIMDSMCVNAVTAMAGPCSIVLAHIRGNYHFYRGVDWPGFIQGANYGDDVSEHIPSLFTINTSSYPWPFYANMGEVYFKGTSIPVSSLQEQFSFNEMNLSAFKNLIYQLQIIMTPEKLKTIQTAILNIVSLKERELRQSEPVRRMIEESRFKEIKQYIKAQKAVYVDIVSLLQNAISLQKSSSRKHDINRLMRKEVINANVEEAATKTMGDMIDELCTELGTISCLIDNGMLTSLLTSLKSGTVAGWLKNQEDKYLTNVTNTCSRMNVLDGTTTSALLDNALLDNNPSMYVCPSMSIRNIYEERHKYESIMFLPLHDKTYEDPYAVSWPNETNDKKVALLRIKMRSIIAAAVEQGFSPANKEINNAIIYLYFCILEKLTTGITPTNDQDSVVRNISRAIISSILCASSSGQSPMPLYQLASYNTPVTVPDSSIRWMYFKLRTLWKYTGWDETVIDRKFKHFIVKCVRKHIVDPVTSKLRQTNRQRKLNNINERSIKRNVELIWLRETIPLIKAGGMPAPYEGEVTTRGGAIINAFLKHERNDNGHVFEVCDAIVKKRTRGNWKTHVTAVQEEEPIDRRINLRNLPDIDQFNFSNMAVFKNVVKTLFDNHMNIERSEELAIQLL